MCLAITLYIAQKSENVFCNSKMIIHFSDDVTHIVDIIDVSENINQYSELHVDMYLAGC